MSAKNQFCWDQTLCVHLLETFVNIVGVNRFLLGYGLNISPDRGGSLVEEKWDEGLECHRHDSFLVLSHFYNFAIFISLSLSIYFQ